MEGHGDWVALLMLGDKQFCLRLPDCLYVPGAMVDLLSVGRMMAAGWELRFKGNPSHCELYHSNEHLGDVPMKYNLCQLSIKFLCPVQPVKSSTVGTHFAAFTLSKQTWDLWRAHPSPPSPLASSLTLLPCSCAVNPVLLQSTCTAPFHSH